MTTKTDKPTLMSALLPLFATATEYALKTIATTGMPAHEKRKGHRALSSASAKGAAALGVEIFQMALHEEGHAAVMRHLDPESDPHTAMTVVPKLTDEGIGLSLEGASCSGMVEFDDPRERAMISVAGWLAESVLAVQMASKLDAPENENPLAGLFDGPGARMLTNPTVLVRMFVSDELKDAFPGNDGDSGLLREAAALYMRNKHGDRFGDTPPTDADERREMIAEVDEFLRGAMCAALRVLERDGDAIIEASLTRAHQTAEAVLHAMDDIAAGVEAIAAAGWGFYGENAAQRAADHVAKRKALVKGTWKGEKQ